MVKKDLANGLLELTLLLSLMRTDVRNLMNTDMYYPEINEIIMGETSAYTQTHFHSQNWNSDVGYISPKHVDSYNRDLILTDLHSLGNDRRFENIDTSFSAWLVNNQEQQTILPSNSEDNGPTSDANNNSHQNNENISLIAGEPMDSQVTTDSNVLDSHSLRRHAEYPSDELTKEDMDLIEVLWRQDIDLGVGREVFDLNLRKELEKEKEIELQKQQEKDKQEAQDLVNQEQPHQQPGVEYVLDGETGELVPVPTHSHEPMSTQEVAPQTGSTEFTQQQSVPDLMPSIEDMMRILEERVDAGPLPNLTSLPDVQLTSDMHQELQNLLNQSQEAEMEMERPPGYDQSWSDMSEMMHINSLINSTSNCTEPMINPPIMTSNPSEALVQNTSMVPQANYSYTQDLTGFTPFSDLEVLPPSTMNTSHILPVNTSLPPVNTSLPPSDSTLLQLDNQDLLFQNLSSLPAQNMSLPAQDEYLRDLLEEDLDNLDFSDLVLNEASQYIAPTESTVERLDEVSSDSAVSSMDGSVASSLQDFYDVADGSPSLYDGLEGATGGSESTNNKVDNKYEKTEPDYTLTDYGYGGEVPVNVSSNGTDYDARMTAADTRQIAHNHTYPLHPGQQPKESMKRSQRASASSTSQNNTMVPYSSRDQKRAKAIGVPFSCDEIVNSPVERFNEMMTKYTLNDIQLQLIRDIRRRGKNKVAAQNCRKRKLDVINNLDGTLSELREARDQLQEQQRIMLDEKRQVEHKYLSLYNEVFRSLRDESGHPYDPSQYSLQQTADGDVFLVPRNTTTTDLHPNSSRRKRKDRERS